MRHRIPRKKKKALKKAEATAQIKDIILKELIFGCVSRRAKAYLYSEGLLIRPKTDLTFL